MLGPKVWNKTFRGTTSAVIETEKWLDEIGREQKLPPEVAFALQTCAEELLTNIAKHGGRSLPDIDLTLKVHRDRVVLVVEDDGQPFDVAAAPGHFIVGPLAEVEPGGLGIQLIRSFTDDLSYERADAVIEYTRQFDCPRTLNFGSEARIRQAIFSVV